MTNSSSFHDFHDNENSTLLLRVYDSQLQCVFFFVGVWSGAVSTCL